MTCTAVEVNVGGPAALDVVGARRGSRWFLPLAFSDDLDLSPITAAKITLRPVGGGTAIEIVGDITQKASGVITFTAAKAATVAVAAGTYSWEVELTAPTGNRLDGWAPLAGIWRVVERVAA